MASFDRILVYEYSCSLAYGVRMGEAAHQHSERKTSCLDMMACSTATKRGLSKIV